MSTLSGNFFVFALLSTNRRVRQHAADGQYGLGKGLFLVPVSHDSCRVTFDQPASTKQMTV